jgi:hypothetical protein
VRRWPLVALVAFVPVALLAVVRPEGRPVIPDRPTSESPPTTLAVPPARPDVDLGAIRDIFRFDDEEPSMAEGPVSTRAAPVAPPSEAPEVRLVGLVRRGPRLLAALALGGDVFVLAAGDSAGGYAVLDVSEEGVRLRGPQGREKTLVWP